MVREEMMTRSEVSEALQISESMVRKLDKQGALHPQKDGYGRVRYHAPEVREVRAVRALGTGVGTPPDLGEVGEAESYDDTESPVPTVQTYTKPPPAVAAALAADPQVVAAWRETELARAKEAEARANYEAEQLRTQLENDRAATARQELRSRIRAHSERVSAGYVGRERGAVASTVRSVLAEVHEDVLADDDLVDEYVGLYVEQALVAHREEQATATQRLLRKWILEELGNRLRELGLATPGVARAVAAVRDDLLRVLDEREVYGEAWLRHRSWVVTCRALGIPEPVPPMKWNGHAWQPIGAGE